MASITIRNLDERVKHNMRMQAAAHGVSMEQEARNALSQLFDTPNRPKDPKAAAKALMAKLAAMPRGEPIDPRYETLDHKTLTDMIWEGEL